MKNLIVIAAASLTTLFAGCNKKSSTTLSPARDIVGTWTSPLADTFYYATDFCADYERVSMFTLKSKWIITAGKGDTVNIEWDALNMSSTTPVISPSCDGAVPWVFPYFLTGVVSSTSLTLYYQGAQVGSFSFTTNNLMGTFNEKDCLIYCSGMNTNTNAFILTR